MFWGYRVWVIFVCILSSVFPTLLLAQKSSKVDCKKNLLQEGHILARLALEKNNDKELYLLEQANGEIKIFLRAHNDFDAHKYFAYFREMTIKAGVRGLIPLEKEKTESGRFGSTPTSSKKRFAKFDAGKIRGWLRPEGLLGSSQAIYKKLSARDGDYLLEIDFVGVDEKFSRALLEAFQMVPAATHSRNPSDSSTAERFNYSPNRWIRWWDYPGRERELELSLKRVLPRYHYSYPGGGLKLPTHYPNYIQSAGFSWNKKGWFSRPKIPETVRVPLAQIFDAPGLEMPAKVFFWMKFSRLLTPKEKDDVLKLLSEKFHTYFTAHVASPLLSHFTPAQKKELFSIDRTDNPDFDISHRRCTTIGGKDWGYLLFDTLALTFSDDFLWVVFPNYDPESVNSFIDMLHSSGLIVQQDGI